MPSLLMNLLLVPHDCLLKTIYDGDIIDPNKLTLNARLDRPTPAVSIVSNALSSLPSLEYWRAFVSQNPFQI